jgi:hypothetical protein
MEALDGGGTTELTVDAYSAWLILFFPQFSPSSHVGIEAQWEVRISF